MKLCNLARFSTAWLTTAAVAIVLAAVTPAATQSAGGPAVPDVVVLVSSGLGQQDIVSFTYSGKVTETEARKALLELQRASGWRISDVRVSTGSVEVGGGSPMASVEFVSPKIVDRTAGTLPVEPFLVAFRRLKLVEIDYIIQGDFVFRGLRVFRNKYIDIDFSQTGNTYRYRVRIKNPSFERLGLPQTQPEGVKRNQTTERPPVLTAVKVLAAVAIAVVISAAVYALSVRISRTRY